MNEEDFRRVLGMGALAGGIPTYRAPRPGPAPRGRLRALWPGVRALAVRLGAAARRPARAAGA